MKHALKKIIIIYVFAMLVFAMGGCKQKSGKPVINQSEPVSFIKGADISTLEEVEDLGGKFYDFDGNETDAIEFLMENGCNYFRLRVWNDPSKSYDKTDYCNPEHTVEMAKRIKEAGGRYLLDFHYSDWWADPQQQNIPSAWKDMSEDELVQAVYDFTKEVLLMLAEENAYPDMVQIGNEIGNGMLWDYGSIDNPDTLAKLLNSGIKAVRDTTPNGYDTKVMLHVEYGGSVDATEKFFDKMTESGVEDFDIIGLSYYPYWSGTLADLKNNIENTYIKYDRPVVVVETAYPFTDENADYIQNAINKKDTEVVGLEASEDNQYNLFQAVMSTVASAQGGFGVLYWEPAWITVEGAGAQGSSTWENQALFDFEGKPLEAIKVFGFQQESIEDAKPLTVYKMDDVEIDNNASDEDISGELPKTAKVLYSDGSIKSVEVTWDISTKESIADASLTFRGMVAGFETSVIAHRVDKYSPNNLSFEEGEKGWIIEGDVEAAWATNGSESCPKEGDFSLSYWDDKEFAVDIYQYVKITKSGLYVLNVWSEGKGGTELSLTLYIADQGGKYIKSKAFENTGWAEWKQPSVSAYLNEGDIIRIGVKVEGVYDDWGALDEFEFYIVEHMDE